MNTIEPLAVSAPFTGTVSIPLAAIQQRDEIIEHSKLITSVDTQSELEAASIILRGFAGLEKATEDGRVKEKKPALDFGREVDDFAKLFLKSVAPEKDRVKKLVDAYNTREFLRKQKEERELAAKQKQLADDAAKAAKALEAAATPAAQMKAELALETIELKKQSVATALAAPTNTPRGMTIRARYDFEILNLLSFLGSFPIYANVATDKESLKVHRADMIRDLNDSNPNSLNALLPREEHGETEARCPGYGIKVFLDINTRTRR